MQSVDVSRIKDRSMWAGDRWVRQSMMLVLHARRQWKLVLTPQPSKAWAFRLGRIVVVVVAIVYLFSLSLLYLSLYILTWGMYTSWSISKLSWYIFISFFLSPNPHRNYNRILCTLFKSHPSCFLRSQHAPHSLSRAALQSFGSIQSVYICCWSVLTPPSLSSSC